MKRPVRNLTDRVMCQVHSKTEIKKIGTYCETTRLYTVKQQKK